jgi:hypothetical protein
MGRAGDRNELASESSVSAMTVLPHAPRESGSLRFKMRILDG